MNPPSSLLDEALGLVINPLSSIPNRVILIKDCVETSAAFILHHFIKRSLLNGGDVVFVAFSQPFSHYDRIMRKMGYNLSMQSENKRLQFLDMMKSERPTDHKRTVKHSSLGQPIATFYTDLLVGLYAKIQSAVEDSSSRDRHVTIMIDDLSLLEIAVRGSVDHVLDFLHYCAALTSELDCMLVILTHEDIYPSVEATGLLSNLEYLAHAVIKTEPLSTGLAADVHGQLTITRKAVFDKQSYSAISNFHFKINENGVDYFYPGSRH